MTLSLFSVDTFSLPLLAGSILMLLAAFFALLQRHNVRTLILWGALYDTGLLCAALAAQTPASGTGLRLFLLFQIFARVLALAALRALAHGTFPNSTPAKKQYNIADLHGAGAAKPVAASFLALGLLAAVGGSPFFVPEGRLLMVKGILEASVPGGIFALILAAVTGTVFIWLYVDAVRRIALAPATEACATELTQNPANSADTADDIRAKGRPLLYAAGFWAVITAVAGLARDPLTSLLGASYGFAPSHAAAHPAFWCLYAGAFVTAAVFYLRPKLAPLVGVLFAALAFTAVCVIPAPPASRLFLVIIAIIAFVVCLYSVGYMAHGKHPALYWFFLLLTFASVTGIVSTPGQDAFYGYWELMTFASYFLVVHERNRTAFDAGLKYYVMCAGGALFMLPGLIMFSTWTAPGADFIVPQPLLQAALAFCLAGFAVKAGLVPLHAWLPDAHPAAPSSVSGPLSGIITKMGIFGIIAVILMPAGKAISQMPGLYSFSWFGTALVFMGAATLIFGEVSALRQNDIKRMLAYSTLGQLGEICLILGLGTWLATAGALWHVLNHAIMKDLLFLGAGTLIMRAGSRNLADLRGLGRQMPWTVACMAVGLVSIMGLPPFGAFFSKYLMVQAAVSAGQFLPAVLILAGSLVGAIYYTRILKVLIFEERPAHLPVVEEAPKSMLLALLTLAALSLCLGLAPQSAARLVIPVASFCFAPVPADAQILAALNIPWPIYVIVPVFGAILPAFFSRSPKAAGWAGALVLVLTALLVAIFGRDEMDTLSYGFALIVPLAGALNMVYAVGYMDHSKEQWRFYCAFVCMCGGLVGMAASHYLLSFFLFWEIMSSWALYMAIAHEGDRQSLREAFKYFIFNLWGAAFIFLGVCVMGPLTPFTADLLHGLIPHLPRNAAWLGMGLLAAGFTLKAAQLPLRIDWQMHPALAPTPVSGYISSVLLKSAVIGLIKLFLLFGGGFAAAGILNGFEQYSISTLVAWIGGITIIIAAVRAMQTNVIKLIFIYSTVSQLGYMVLAVAAGNSLGYAGGMLHLINHIFFKDLLFLICGAVMFATHKDSLDDLGGIGRKMPFTLAMFALAGLSVVGIPPTSGFSSKWIIYHALMQAEQPFLALLSLVGSVLTLAYIAKFLHAAFLGQPGRDLDHVHEAPLIMRIPMGILGLGCVLTGVFPGLALMPINTVFAEYGLAPLSINLSGLTSGPGAWNATGLSVMVFIAFLTGWLFLKRFVRLREIDVHTCGLPPEIATSRMNPTGIYDGLSLLPGNPEPGREPAKASVFPKTDHALALHSLEEKHS